MSILNYIQAEHLQDVNIEIKALRNITEYIQRETAAKQDVTVLLFSGQFKAKQILDAINAEWSPSFHDYLKTNRIQLKDIICVTPYDDVIIETPKPLHQQCTH